MTFDWKAEKAKLIRAYEIAEQNHDWAKCEEISKEIIQVEDFIAMEEQKNVLL